MLFLDSDIIIDIGNGVQTTLAWMAEREAEGASFAVTTVNLAELRRGARAANRRMQAALARFEERLPALPLDDAAAHRFGELMGSLDAAGRPLSVPDGLIAAIVLEHGGRLATRNVRDFGRVAGLQVLEVA